MSVANSIIRSKLSSFATNTALKTGAIHAATRPKGLPCARFVLAETCALTHIFGLSGQCICNAVTFFGQWLSDMTSNLTTGSLSPLELETRGAVRVRAGGFDASASFMPQLRQIALCGCVVTKAASSFIVSRICVWKLPEKTGPANCRRNCQRRHQLLRTETDHTSPILFPCSNPTS